MRYASLCGWALASLVAIDGVTISPRQAVQTSQTVASSFTQVTQTYSSISQYFVQTRQQIQSATTLDQCSSVLTQLTTQISQAVQSISGGCDCAADGVDTSTLESMISTWFVELQSITQVVQSRFPSSYQSFRSTFTQISYHMETALGVAYSTGLNMDNIVQRAAHRSNIDTGLLSRFNINTSRFTNISSAVSSRTGAFRNGPPKGYRFSNQLPVHGGDRIKPPPGLPNQNIPPHLPTTVPGSSYSPPTTGYHHDSSTTGNGMPGFGSGHNPTPIWNYGYPGASNRHNPVYGSPTPVTGIPGSPHTLPRLGDSGYPATSSSNQHDPVHGPSAEGNGMLASQVPSQYNPSHGSRTPGGQP